MTYARSRLWLGVTTVGTLVVVATCLLMSQGHADFIGSASDSNAGELKSIAICVAAFATLMIPFDLLGGIVLPRRFGRKTPRLPRLILSWLRAVLIQSACLTASLWIVLQAGQTIGIAGAIAAVVMIQIGLVATQKWLAILTGGISLESNVADIDAAGPRIATAHHMDSGFTGSIVGLPGSEEVVVPQSWQSRMTPEELDTQLVRRIGAIRTGSRTRGLLLALLVNTGTFGICAVLPNAGVTTVPQLATAALYFTFASFLWLLLLPRTSREGVFEADRFAFDNGHSVRQIEATANHIESLHDDEPQRSRRLESIFHPVPCVQRRVAELSLRTRSIDGCWNAARMTLFLSWACGGFLSRAVHCNIGRPELWVILPTD